MTNVTAQFLSGKSMFCFEQSQISHQFIFYNAEKFPEKIVWQHKGIAFSSDPVNLPVCFFPGNGHAPVQVKAVGDDPYLQG